MSDDNDWDTEWESGPFCEHWDDPSVCEVLCACGHTCAEHNGGVCDHRDCECAEFTDKEAAA